MRRAGRNRDDRPNDTIHLDRECSLRRRPVSQLPIIVVAPATDGPVGLQHDCMIVPAGYHGLNDSSSRLDGREHGVDSTVVGNDPGCEDRAAEASAASCGKRYLIPFSRCQGEACRSAAANRLSGGRSDRPSRTGKGSDDEALVDVDRDPLRDKARVGRSVPKLTVSVSSPGPDRAVTMERDRMGRASRNRGYSGQGSYLNRCRPLRRRPVTQTAILVIAPGPDGAVVSQRDSMARPGSDGRYAFQPQNLHRHCLLHRTAISQLPVGVITPRPHRTVTLQGNRVASAACDSHDSGQTVDPHGEYTLRGTGVTELASGIATPGPDGAVIRKGQRVRNPGRKRGYPRKPVHFSCDGFLVRGSSVPELPGTVCAPGPDRPVALQCHRVRTAGSYRRDSGHSACLHGCVPLRESPVPQLAFAV